MTSPKREPTQHEALQANVVQLLAWTGWRHLHVRRSLGKGNKWVTTTNLKGWPDLAPLWNVKQPGRFLAVEVKIPPDWLRTEQTEVLEELGRAGMECFVVVPDMRGEFPPSPVPICDLEGLSRVLARKL